MLYLIPKNYPFPQLTTEHFGIHHYSKVTKPFVIDQKEKISRLKLFMTLNSGQTVKNMTNALK